MTSRSGVFFASFARGARSLITPPRSVSSYIYFRTLNNRALVHLIVCESRQGKAGRAQTTGGRQAMCANFSSPPAASNIMFFMVITVLESGYVCP